MLETKSHLVGIGFVFHPSLRFIGDRIETAFISDVNKCATKCANRAGCNYFNYDSQSLSCSLYSTIDGAVKDKNTTTSGMTHPGNCLKYYKRQNLSIMEF